MTILEEATKIIYGDREKTYGTPESNLGKIGSYWTQYMKDRYGFEGKIDAIDVSLMMILLKVARLSNQPTHRDSQVDICGYAALIERIQNFQKEVVNNVSLSTDG